MYDRINIQKQQITTSPKDKTMITENNSTVNAETKTLCSILPAKATCYFFKTRAKSNNIMPTQCSILRVKESIKQSEKSS